MAQRHDGVLNLHTSGGSRPSDKEGEGDGHPDPEIRGRPASKKNFFALRASFSSKNKAIAGGPGLLPWIRHCIPR